jgi:hypothetical protein
MFMSANGRRETIRSLLILAVVGAVLLLPHANYAEPSAECQAQCAEAKASGDASCARTYEDETDQRRVDCVQDSQENYNSCINECPQSMPTDTTIQS